MTHATFTPDFDGFRFYADGSESGSSPLAAQGVNVIVEVVVGTNNKVHLRCRVQEAGGASGKSGDDWQLQYNKNSTGTWVPITASTSNIQADTASALTDGALTTNRATNGIADGTGSFVAGEQEETNGIIEGRQLTASNFTEHVWALAIIASDVVHGDTFDFRITLNAANPGMVNTAAPRITINRTFTPTLSAFRFYINDGSENASTPFAAQDTNINLVVLVDASGQIRGYHDADGAGIDEILRGARRIVREQRQQARSR